MRKLFSFLLVVAFMLSACTQAALTPSTDDSTVPSQASQESPPATVPSTMATTPPTEETEPVFHIPDEGTPLRAYELEVFTRLFNYCPDNLANHPGMEPYGYYYWYRYILSVEFDTPENVNLRMLFYNGTQFTELSQEEEAFIASTGKGTDSEVHRIDPLLADEVLKQYFGLTWAETNLVGLEHAMYDPDTGLYYRFAGDVGGVTDVQVLGGSVLTDGSVRLYYIPNASISQNNVHVLTMVSNSDRDGIGYRFLSNLPVT